MFELNVVSFNVELLLLRLLLVPDVIHLVDGVVAGLECQWIELDLKIFGLDLIVHHSNHLFHRFEKHRI